MRIGVRVTGARVTGVAVRSDGGFDSQSLRVAAPAGIPVALDAVLGRLARAGERRAVGEPITSVRFDVSALLASAPGEAVTVIRIAPRPPIDPSHDVGGRTTAHLISRIAHIAGGHTKAGEELAPLDVPALEAFAASVPHRGRYVVTSVGAPVNPAHEIEAGRILQDHAKPASVGYSNAFSNTSFAIRERTAVVNGALVARAESLGTTLGLVTGARIPNARLYVTTNDGGCVPLAGLAVTPVHSMLADRASELIGAAALTGLGDGRMLIADADRLTVGELIDGAPTVMPKVDRHQGEPLATRAAHLLPAFEGLISGRVDPPVVVATASAPDDLPFGLTPALRARVDLCALGAACAPLTEWVQRIVTIGDAADMEQALAAAEARVSARLVSFGAIPSQVRILESRVVATAYENPNIVGVRVRGVAGDRVDGILRSGGAHEAD